MGESLVYQRPDAIIVPRRSLFAAARIIDVIDGDIDFGHRH
jgi:hypothetical protein